MVSVLTCITIAVVSLVVGLIFGHRAGYWYGRTLELYESGKKYGVLPKEITFQEWLSKNE